MTRYTYPAIITYYPDKGSYVADFPDFPGAMLFSIGIEPLLDSIGHTLKSQIEADIKRGKPIPEPTPFEQHLHQDENCVSWWTIAQCDVDENFKRIIDGLNDVVEGNVVIKYDATDNGIPAEEVQAAFHENRPKASNLMRIVKSRLA